MKSNIALFHIKRKIINTIVFLLLSIAVFGQQEYSYYSFRFRTEAKYRGVQFDSVANFKSALFDSANFYDAQWDSAAYFSSAQFNSVAYFRKAHFKSKVCFSITHFIKKADFRQVRFDSAAHFRDAQFYSVANFNGAQFHSIANYTMAEFNVETDFRNAQFDSTAHFDYTYLPKILYFQNVEINGNIIDFTRALVRSLPDKRCQIYLQGTDISKIKLRYEMFQLKFEDPTPFDIKANVYETLLKQTELLGYKKSYELLDKEYKEVTYLEGFKKPKRGRNWLEKNWWGYGYNKELIIRNTIVLFLFFSFINSLFYRKLSLKLYEMPKLLAIRDKIESKNKIVLFLKVFPLAVFYTGFIFFGFSFNVDKLKYSENLNGWRIFYLIYFFTIYLIGIVCVGYLANFILSS